MRGCVIGGVVLVVGVLLVIVNAVFVGNTVEELTEARTAIWEVLRPYRMKLLRLAPAKFIHFGTTHELLELMTEEMLGIYLQ